MSIRVYRLLRNNKEEGPFTSEELIQKNLKPYDLIWIDGRSAAWSYPGEIPEFKIYASLPGENLINQTNKQQPAIVSPSVQAAIAVNNSIAPTAIQQKPRYKVSAAWSKIQTVTAPVYKRVTADEPQKPSPKRIIEAKQSQDLQSKSLSWKEAWLDWEKEKVIPPVIEPVKAKPGVAAPTKPANKEYTPVVLETKYSEPLDSLKDKYIENILQQKKNSNKSFLPGKVSEFIIPSIALLVIFSIAYWLLHNTDTISASAPATSKSIQPAVTSNTNQPAANTNDPAADPAASTSTTEKKQNITSTNEPAITHAEDRKPGYRNTAKLTTDKQADHSKQESKLPATQVTLPGSNTTSHKTADKPAKLLNAPVSNSVSKENINKEGSTANTADLNADNNKTNTTDAVNDQSLQKETPVIKKVKVKSGTDYVSVPEHIEMNGGIASLSIQNISDINLDLVVVDLQYYDASNHFRKGETIYLHNLRAGKNVIVKTPKDINSLYATSKISLVSSDAENVYVIGDH